jgi:flagellar biogenesis protein FliO
MLEILTAMLDFFIQAFEALNFNGVNLGLIIVMVCFLVWLITKIKGDD